MKYYLYTDSPTLYKNNKKFYIQGSSPCILKNLIDFVKSRANKIDKIFLCIYLYNNLILDQELHELAKAGINIEIISIPLEGYDARNPQNLYDIKNMETPLMIHQTKYSLAESLYQKIKNRHNVKFEFRIFPHMYVRSERVHPFSRGNMPYSLHAKSIFIQYKNGGGVTGLTSSNLAVRDLVKEEIMLLVENNEVMNKEAERFFQHLCQYSFNINNFDNEKQDWLKYSMPITTRPLNIQNTYIVPFYQDVQGSVENYIIGLLKTAKQRIMICAQHICAYNYSYNSNFDTRLPNNGYVRRPGILNEVINKSREGLLVKCLSQTFVGSNGNSKGCRHPENINAFMGFIREYEKNSNSFYAANDSAHSKYMIIDDVAIITTCNFTPTQFIYLDNVAIEKFDHIPDLAYRGIHSEVGQFMMIRDLALCEALIENFNQVWNRPDTYIHKQRRAFQNNKKCPKCNSEMKKRNGKYGEFWGCTAYPKCKYTENI